MLGKVEGTADQFCLETTARKKQVKVWLVYTRTWLLEGRTLVGVQNRLNVQQAFLALDYMFLPVLYSPLEIQEVLDE
jgi:hypothetical protein